MSIIALITCFDAVDKVSNVGWLQLLLEHGIVIAIAVIMINKILKNYSLSIRVYYLNFFLIAFIASILLLYFFWTDSLVEESNFDPARYYRYAITIITGEGEKEGLNYYGVVYFYAFFMRIFGIDPIVPLFVNVLLTLFAVLCAGKLLGDKKSIHKYSYLLLIPEIVLYNIYSSREIICMSMATICVVKYIEISRERKISNIIILIISFLLFAIVRPPMAVVLILILFFHILTNTKSKYRFVGIFIVISLAIATSVALSMSADFGSAINTEHLENSFTNDISGDVSERGDTKEGLTRMLIPHNAFEYFVFGIIRSFAYVLPPPVLFTNTFNEFSLSNMHFSENLTTILLFIFLSKVFKCSRKYKQLPSDIKFICLSLLAYFFFIGISLPNLIHNRYRLVYDMLYFIVVIYVMNNKKFFKSKDH